MTIGGIAAPLNFVSPGQINAVIPFEVAIPANPLGTVPVVVTTSAGVSAPLNIRLSRNAPALFTKAGTGTGAVLAFDGNFHEAAGSANGPLVLYAGGLGPTVPPLHPPLVARQLRLSTLP